MIAQQHFTPEEKIELFSQYVTQVTLQGQILGISGNIRNDREAYLQK